MGVGGRQREEYPAAVEFDPGGVRQRQDEPQRQLVALRQVHGHPLRLQGRSYRRTHQQLPAGKVTRHHAADGRTQFSLLLPGTTNTQCYYQPAIR